MAVSVPTVEIIAIVFLISPGYISYMIFRHFADITNPVDRFDKMVWGILGSGISVSVLYFIYSAVMYPKAWPTIPLNVRALSIAFPFLLFIGMIVGAVSGFAMQKFQFHDFSRSLPQPTWNYLMKKVEKTEGPTEVRVKLKQGPELWGQAGPAGTTNDMRDILLMWPQRVIRDKGEIVEKIDDGKFVYIREDSVETIYFDDDPNVIEDYPSH